MKSFIRNCTIALLGALFFMSTTCEPEILDQQMVIVNNQTNEEILVFSAIGNYTDIIKENLELLYRSNKTKLLSPNSANIIDDFFWHQNDGTPKYDTLLIMIIRSSTMDKYQLDYLIENDIYDDKYILNYDELKLMNFQVKYKDCPGKQSL